MQLEKRLINIQLIEDYRKQNNLTKKQFCNLCKISTKSYQNVLNGKNFYVSTLFKIAFIMKVHVKYLVLN